MTVNGQKQPLPDGVYFDMTTSSTGQQVSFQERLDDIFNRYKDEDIVSIAIHKALPFLKSVDLAQIW